MKKSKYIRNVKCPGSHSHNLFSTQYRKMRVIQVVALLYIAATVSRRYIITIYSSLTLVDQVFELVDQPGEHLEGLLDGSGGGEVDPGLAQGFEGVD